MASPPLRLAAFLGRRTLKKRSTFFLLLVLLCSLSLLRTSNRSFRGTAVRHTAQEAGVEDEEFPLTREVILDSLRELDAGVSVVQTPCRRQVILGGVVHCNHTTGNKTCTSDGGKYICMDEDVRLVPGQCVALNFGIGFDFSFDNALVNYGCRVMAFDPTNFNITDRVQRATIPGSLAVRGRSSRDHRGEFMALNIGLDHKNYVVDLHVTIDNGTFGDFAAYFTLGSVIQLFDIPRVDVLKIDIEGAEWRVLTQVLRSRDASRLLRGVRQILLEIHLEFVSAQADGGHMYDEAWRILDILRQLQRHGFHIAAVATNDTGQMRVVMSELTFPMYRELTLIKRPLSGSS